MSNMHSHSGYYNSQIVDEGLRQWMLGVYNWLGSGLFLSAISAFMFAAILPVEIAMQMKWMTLLGLGMIVAMMFSNPLNWKTGSMKAFYLVFVFIQGIAFVPLLIVFDPMLLGKAFLSAAAVFGGMSIVGYTTKKNLSGWGVFLFGALLGLIIASLINVFFQSGIFSFIISVTTVFVFSGLVAWETQSLKKLYLSGQATENQGIMGALSLYLDFINLFRAFLSIIGFLSSDD